MSDAADVVRALADAKCPYCDVTVTGVTMKKERIPILSMAFQTHYIPGSRRWLVSPCGHQVNPEDGERLMGLMEL